MSTGTEQFNAGLVANFHPSAGEQRYSSAQVGQFGALAEIEISALGTKLIVKMVNLRVILFADVAVLGFDNFAGRWGLDVHEFFRRVNVWRGEDRAGAQLTDAALVQDLLIALDFVSTVLALGGPQQTSPLGWLGTIHFASGLDEAAAFVGGEPGHERAVLGDGFQRLQGGPQLCCFVLVIYLSFHLAGQCSKDGTQRQFPFSE